jgi:hypothetical protein
MGSTILLIPVCLLFVVGFVVFIAYGWVGLALAIGRLIGRRVHQHSKPELSAPFGMVVRMIFTMVAGLLPVVGDRDWFGTVGCSGIGAADGIRYSRVHIGHTKFVMHVDLGN